ncbi:MAG TPA: hypothetical protein PKY05_02210 [Fibrobacteria bacterium]|nr:hypothetical protein [Fibrobacteria bacterium]
MIWAMLAQSWCAAFEARLPAAAVEGRGGPSVAWISEGDPADANPALVARKGGEVGGGLTRPLGLVELSLGGLWGRVPLGAGWALGGRWKSLRAAELYREDAWGGDLAWAGGRWAMGCGMRGGHVSLEGEDLGTPLGGAVGISVRLVEGFSVAGVLEDPSFLGTGGLAQPWTLGLGGALEGRDSSWAGDLSVERRQIGGWSGRVGQELRLEPLRIRAGLRANPWTISVGLGGGFRGVRMDWALEGDPDLGWQHHISSAWSF